MRKKNVQPAKPPESQVVWTREYVRGLITDICKHTGAGITIRWPSERKVKVDEETLTQDYDG